METTSLCDASTMIWGLRYEARLIESALAEPGIIIRIVAYTEWQICTVSAKDTRTSYIGHGLLQVCNRWTQALYNAVKVEDAHLQWAVERACLPAAPALVAR